MSVKTQKTVKVMKDAIKYADAKKPHPYDASATVVRVEGNIAWVHFDGGAEETPVRKTINAKTGDTVQVRVGGGDAWIVGNATAPPTDDAVANRAIYNADYALGVANGAREEALVAINLSELAEEVATRAQTSADGKNTIYYGSTQPSTGNQGDTWFNGAEDNAIYIYNGSTWVKQELGEDAIANLSITNAKIVNGTIQSAKIANLDAGKITSGTIDTNRLDVSGIISVGGLATDAEVAVAKSEAIADGRKYADNYLTVISGTTGISVHNQNNVSDYVNITSNAVHIASNGTKVASFTPTMLTLGISGQNRVQVQNDSNYQGLEIFDNSNNSIAWFGGGGIRVGKSGADRFLVNTSSLQAYDSSNNKYFEVSANGITYGSSTAVASQSYADGVASTAEDNAKKVATNYLYYVNSTDGLIIADASPSTSTRKVQINSGGVRIQQSANNYARLLSDGLYITQDGNSVARFGATSRIGDENDVYVWVGTSGTSTGMEIVRVDDATTSPVTKTSLAWFGATTRIGASANSQSRVTIQPSGIDFISRNSSGTDVNLAHLGYASGTAQSGTAVAPYYTLGSRDSGTVGNYSTVLGNMGKASGYASLSFGMSNTASGQASLAGGQTSQATGIESFAYGRTTTASGKWSFAEGYGTTASGDYSFASGYLHTAKSLGQTVIGYNAYGDSTGSATTKGTYAFIIGGGSETVAKNIFTVDWSGNVAYSGKIQTLYMVSSTTVATGSISANSAKSATNYDITNYSTYIDAGYEPVAISGDATDNSAVSAFARIYDVSGTKKIRATFRNNSSSAVSTSYYFYILWLKATS